MVIDHWDFLFVTGCKLMGAGIPEDYFNPLVAKP
jgi:hypothetical protein